MILGCDFVADLRSLDTIQEHNISHMAFITVFITLDFDRLFCVHVKNNQTFLHKHKKKKACMYLNMFCKDLITTVRNACKTLFYGDM